MVGAPVRRRQVAYVHQRGVSIRRACALMSVARSTWRYESRIVRRDAPVVAIMRELAAQYPRYGYRRIQVFLGRRVPIEPIACGVSKACKYRETAAAADRDGAAAPVAGNGRGVCVGL